MKVRAKFGFSYPDTIRIRHRTHSSPHIIKTGTAIGTKGQTTTVIIEKINIKDIQTKPAIIVMTLILKPTNLDIILSIRACI